MKDIEKQDAQTVKQLFAVIDSYNYVEYRLERIIGDRNFKELSDAEHTQAVYWGNKKIEAETYLIQLLMGIKGE